ncbi:MAG: tetratricopeptide repeat protein [bacterium]|nr:MAG: tetratricopeptide repeat protein [bacterium]
MNPYKRTLALSLIIPTLLSILGCAGTSQKREENIREGQIHMQMGSNYLNKGNIELALFELTKASRLIPEDPDVHFALGTVHLLREEAELAMEEFLRTVSLNREHADAYNNLGYTYLKLGRWDEAIEASQKALGVVNYDTPERAMTIIGWAYYKKGESGRALEMLKRALNVKDNQPDTENRIATIYLEEGRLDKAKIILQDLAKRYPRFSSARLNLGIVYYKERDFVAARREFKAVVDLVDRQSEEARLARGYLDLIE